VDASESLFDAHLNLVPVKNPQSGRKITSSTTPKHRISTFIVETVPLKKGSEPISAYRHPGE